MLALWTGQRQGDLLPLPWSAYDGRFIRLRQRKGRKAKASGSRFRSALPSRSCSTGHSALRPTRNPSPCLPPSTQMTNNEGPGCAPGKDLSDVPGKDLDGAEVPCPWRPLRLPRVPTAQSAFRPPTGRRDPRTAGPVVPTRQPVQCAAAISWRSKASSASTVSGMIASVGPARWKPPKTPKRGAGKPLRRVRGGEQGPIAVRRVA
jgi:hypothetical protein